MMPMPRWLVRWGLRCCLWLHGWSYEKAGSFALRYYPVHPKHLFHSYHAFFLQHVRPSDAVLDIACGRGEVSSEVADRVRAVVAFDVNPQAIEAARRHRARANVTYYVGEATRDLPAGQVFDVAISSNILEHLPNPDEHLQALARVARRLLLRVPNLNRSWTVHVRRDLGMSYFSDPTHYREYTVASVRQELERNGWRVASVEAAADELWVVAEGSLHDVSDSGAVPRPAVEVARS